MANLFNEGRITRERAREILTGAYYSAEDWATRQTLADVLYLYFQPQISAHIVEASNELAAD